MAGDPDNQKTPGAIPKSCAPPSTPPKHRHKKANKSLVYILTFLVFISLLLLITFSIILRVTTPNLNLTITSLHLNMTSSSSVNVTLLTDLTISNRRNNGPYTYEKCSALIFDNDVLIGGGDVNGGLVGARTRKLVSASMSFHSNNTDLIDNFVYVKMSGRVRVMKIRNWAKMVEMNCTVRIDLMSKSVMSLLCFYKLLEHYIRD